MLIGPVLDLCFICCHFTTALAFFTALACYYQIQHLDKKMDIRKWLLGLLDLLQYNRERLLLVVVVSLSLISLLSLLGKIWNVWVWVCLNLLV